MFPRVLKQNKAGKTYEYLAISQSVRRNGKSTTENIANLGNVKKFKRQDVVNLIDGLIKIFQLDDFALNDEVEILEALVYGPVMLWQKLWQKMKLSDLIRQHLKQRHNGVSMAVEKYVELMTVNRCIEPLSKLGVSRWFETTCYKALEDYADLPLEVNYFYRSMDYLVEMKDELELAIFNQLRNLFSVNVKLTFYDITSTFFYGDLCPIAEPGYSRDKRPDCGQIVVGVVTSYEGYPLKHYVFEGNTVDSTTVEDVIKDLKQAYHIEETVFVGDRGMITKLNIEQLEKKGFDYIMGVKLRQDGLCQMLFERGEIDWEGVDEFNSLKLLERKVAVKDFLLRKTKAILSAQDITVTDAAFQPFADKIEALTNADGPVYKDFKAVLQGLSPELGAKLKTKIWQVIQRYQNRYEKTNRYVFCLNPDRRVSAGLHRNQRIDKLSKALDELFSKDDQEQKPETDQEQTKAEKKQEKKQTKAELNKAIDKLFSGYKTKFRTFFEIELNPDDERPVGYHKNEDRLEAEKRYDGVFALVASQDKVDMRKVVTSYKNLKEVETLFDDFKNFVDVRPIRHRLEIRVRGHVFICILALLLKRIFEVGCLGSNSLIEPLEELAKVQLIRYKVKFSKREERYQIIPKVTNVSKLQQKYFNLVGIKNPMNIEKFMW